MAGMQGQVHLGMRHATTMQKLYEPLGDAQKHNEGNLDELVEAERPIEQRVAEQVQVQRRIKGTVRSLAKQVGELSETIGASLTDLARDILPELLEKHLGMKVRLSEPEELRLNGEEYPFDLFVRGEIQGCEVLVLCEVKSNVTLSGVKKFLARVEKVQSLAPGKDIRPAFFGYRANRDAREEIVARGASMAFSRGVMIF